MSLTVSQYNLYSNGRIIKFSNGEQLLVRDLIEYEPQENDIYHKVKASDELSILAWRYYSNFIENASKYWWIIADANSIENPLYLTDLVGTEIVIPNILNFKLSI